MDVKLAYLAFPQRTTDEFVIEEVQVLRNAILGDQTQWYLYDINRSWTHSVAADFDEDDRVARSNRAVMAQADAVIVVLPMTWENQLPWECGAASVMGIPCFVITTKAFTHSVPVGVYIRPSVASIIGDLSVLPERVAPTVQGPEAKWIHVDHPTRNDDLLVQPSQAHSDDAGFDLTFDGHQSIVIAPGECVDVPCGVAIEWPPHTWGLLVGRSSTFRNRGLLVNPAIIDPGFRGHLFAIVRNISHEEHTVTPGERVAQIVPLPALAPKIEMKYSQELSESERGTNGFGSSGL